MGATVQWPEKAEQFFAEDKLPEEFGWITWLSPSHQRLFAGEIYAAWKSRLPEDEVAELLARWQATAELDHSPEVQGQIERNRRSGRFTSVEEWLKKRHTA